MNNSEKYPITGEHGGIALNSRVSFYRNFSGLPFPARLDLLAKRALSAAVFKTVKEFDSGFALTDMGTLYPYEAVALAERHIIPPDFAGTAEGHFLLLSSDSALALMLGGEDHIRLRCTVPGLNPEAAFKRGAELERFINSRMPFAFDRTLGFLNQDPSNIGTGLKVSALLHLPALTAAGEMPRFASLAARMGINVRGSYGEAASVRGDMYRLTNTVTMGISEEKAVENLKSLVLQLATKERAAAEKMLESEETADKVKRAEGVLRSAVMLDIDEATELLSALRFGAVYGMNDISPELINSLFEFIEPACLNVRAGERLGEREQKILRAAVIGKALSGGFEKKETGDE